MPPRWLRRVVLAPVALVLIAAVLLSMPGWLLLAAVPAGREQRVDWLYTWWARIDEWTGETAR